MTPRVTPAPPCICTAASITCLRGFGRVELGHCGGAAVVGAALILLPRGAVDQQRRRVDGKRHVGELGLRHRIVGERTASKTPVFGEGQRFVQRAPREAERRRADRHPEQVQRLHPDAETLAGLADDRIGGDADIVVVRAARAGAARSTSIRSATVDGFGRER